MTDIIQRASMGRRQALEALYEQNKQSILFLCRALLREEEAAEAVFVHAFSDLWSEVLRGEVQSEKELQKRLTRKAVIGCRKHILQKDPKALRVPQNKNFLTTAEIGVVDEHAALADIVLDTLEPLQRFLFVLNRVAKLRESEIAKAAHIDENTLKIALNAEQTNLKHILESLKKITDKETFASEKALAQSLADARTNAAVPAACEAQVLEEIRTLSAPIEQKRKQKIMRITVLIVAAAAVLAGIAAAVAVALSGKSDDADATSDGTDSTAFTASSAEDITVTAYADIAIAEYGTVTVALDGTAAPETVENFISLAESGFYDGLTFHRIMDGFMMQGGDPEGNGTGGAENTVIGEFSANGFENNLSHTRGAISMARSDDYDSASSQFFIVQSDSTFLDGQYAAFGYVTQGMELVDQICAEAEPTDDNGTIEADQQPIITSVTIRYK